MPNGSAVSTTELERGVSSADAFAPAAEVPQIPTRTKAVLATGDVVEGVVNGGITTFLLLYLTAVCGLPGTLAGAAMAISLVVDAVADPAIGYTSDTTRSRWGRRHPYMFASALPLALAYGLLFTPIAMTSQWLQFAYVTVLLLVVRIGHSMFMLPYAALGAEITPNYAERSVIMSYRFFFNIITAMAVTFLGLSVFMGGGDGLLDRDAYAPFGWTCAAILLAGALASSFGTFKERLRLSTPKPDATPMLERIVREFRDVFRNRSFVVLFLTAVMFFSAQGTHITLQLHALKYFWMIPEEAVQFIPILGALGWLAGVPIGALMLRRFEKRHIAVGGLAIISLGQFFPPVLKLMGVLPSPDEASVALVAILVAFGMAVGATFAACGIALGSMMADAADEHEMLFGQRREGVYFAGLSLSVKASTGVGVLIAGVALDLIGFPQDPAVLSAGEIPPDVVRALGVVQGPVAAFISFTSALILTRYRIGAKEHARIQAEITRRKVEA